MSDHPSFRIYHNPRCSKSRETLKLLREHQIEPEVIEYLKTPASQNELKEILTKLILSPRDLLRTKEKEYKAAGMDDLKLTDEQLLDLMVANPKVIERPIVVTATQAVIGRPPENVLDIV